MSQGKIAGGHVCLGIMWTLLPTLPVVPSSSGLVTFCYLGTYLINVLLSLETSEAPGAGVTVMIGFLVYSRILKGVLGGRAAMSPMIPEIG